MTKKEILCKGCSAVWSIDVKNSIEAELEQCPLCWDGEDRI